MDIADVLDMAQKDGGVNQLVININYYQGIFETPDVADDVADSVRLFVDYSFFVHGFSIAK